MKVYYCGKEYVVMDHIYKNGEVEVLILDPPHYGKRWITVPYSSLIKEEADKEDF